MCANRTSLKPVTAAPFTNGLVQIGTVKQQRREFLDGHCVGVVTALNHAGLPTTALAAGTAGSPSGGPQVVVPDVPKVF